MKLIEALKQTKLLQRKADDLRDKVQKHSAHLSNETEVYKDQKNQVAKWIQAHSDILKKILELRVDIQRTNLATNVAIAIGVDTVTKSIAEWIHRRRDLAKEESMMWASLTDRNLREGTIKQSTGEPLEVKIIRCFDPAERDAKLEEYISEPTLIDARLEIINAVTDLIE